MVRQLADDARLMGRGRIRDAVRLLLVFGVWPLLHESVRPLIRWALGRPDVPRWIPPAFAKQIGLRDRLHRGGRGSPAASLAQARAFRDATGGMQLHAYETSERQAAWCGIELRHPFQDRRVVEFGLQIPEEQRWRGAVTKFVLREAMTGLLPESVRQRRTKAEFSLAFVQALRDVGAEAPFGSLTLETLGWIDGSRCRDMYRRFVHLSEERDEYLPNVWPLWLILAMELWVTTVVQTQADRGGRAARPASVSPCAGRRRRPGGAMSTNQDGMQTDRKPGSLPVEEIVHSEEVVHSSDVDRVWNGEQVDPRFGVDTGPFRLVLTSWRDSGGI